MKHTFTLEPRDLLFLRDARPMAASDAGLGANWPRPDQLWNAVINAFHRQWPERQPWEGAEHTKRANENNDSSCRFGALKTRGPLPFKDGEIFLPCPSDWNMRVVRCEGTNLPAPLTHAFLSNTKGKASLPAWVSPADYRRYLSGAVSEAPKHHELFDTERNIGVAIDPVTGATVSGKLYQAEYLRLRAGVSLMIEAECKIKPKGLPNLVDVFERADAPKELILGGQQGVARLKTLDTGLRLPAGEITTPLLRWTLLSPALFNAGWRPDWVAPDGRVMLPNAERTPGMSRADWKALASNTGGFPTARLIAARVGKPLAFSGWDLQTGPKPTVLAVPAGSCYVFDCGTPEEAKALAAALSWPRPRSTMHGEKGFGLGVCSSIIL
jgi:CRISPR type III-B/RAMP module-associated protein Cmr3